MTEREPEDDRERLNRRLDRVVDVLATYLP